MPEPWDFWISDGDIVGGRDYITGIVVKKPITKKILNIKDGTCKTEYKIEGGD